MDARSFKTYTAKAEDVDRSWYIVDATNVVVGRLASRIAPILQGKHKPIYTPHVDTGDGVIVINAERIRFTGKKETDKTYFEYSGYPGGDKHISPAELRENDPGRIVYHAVKGMLPNNRLADKMIKKLKIYEGSEHPHEAQQPEPLDV